MLEEQMKKSQNLYELLDKRIEYFDSCVRREIPQLIPTAVTEGNIAVVGQAIVAVLQATIIIDYLLHTLITGRTRPKEEKEKEN